MSYRRKHVSEILFTYAEKINPALTFGRQSDPYGVEDDFILSFFLSCSDDQLEKINSLVGSKENDVLVDFFDGETNYVLSKEQMKSFDFSKYTWEATSLVCGWDELREIPQPIIGVTFYEKKKN